ncbi:MAG: phosphate acetyltransferase, partial [Actinomycetota bacterium]|nr:phosphate acetyltransferase [Actinomycetota bacterium]
KALYLTSMRERSGKAVVALGVMELLVRHIDKVAVFRPVIGGGSARDPLIELLRERYGLDTSYEDMVGFSYADAARIENASGTAHLVSRIAERFAVLRDKFEFVLCVGTDYTGPSAATELALNAEIAVNLGTPVVNVVSGHGKDRESLAAASSRSQEVLIEHGCVVVATVLNRVDRELVAEIRREALSVDRAPVYCLPDLPVLSALTVAEVVSALGATLLAGEGPPMHREVEAYLAGSGYLQTMLPRLVNGTLLVASGDRADLAVAVGAAAMSPALPTPSGIVLTCGLTLDERTLALLEPSGVPVAATEMDTYAALHVLEGLRGEIRPTSARKIAAALGEFAAAVDAEELGARITLVQSAVVTPLMFSAGVLASARADRRSIVLPEAADERVLRAAEELVHQNVVTLTLLGDPESVATRIDRLGLSLPGTTVMDPVASPLRSEFAESYAKLRAHKGVTLDGAWDLMADSSYFATMLVQTGRVDGMVSGATHTTADTVRPALEIIKCAPDHSLISSAFFMCLPQRVLVFADCAVNPDPTAEQLAEIAVCTADTAMAFGIEPRVALVSYSTGSSARGADVDKVRTATAMIAASRPDLSVVGPIQYDAAVDPSVAASKLPGNAIAGRANVLIFPDLNTGNTTYKAVQRSANAVAVGPILQGLRRPVNDLSRGCTVADIVNTVAITAIQAQQLEP